MFGHVDGLAQGVGIPYHPDQAAQWLTQAGYPNGQGLPPITLMYNTFTGHEAIAQVVRQDWIDNLNVTVSLSSTNWSDYQDLLGTDPPQVWRLGYCADHQDAYSFLHDFIANWRVSFGNWSNATYDDLLSQAAGASDSNTRKSLYEQAQEILVETDAVMLPIYYYANGVATRPYLERTYGDGGFGGRLADWRVTRVSASIDPVGGSLASYTGSTTVTVPAGAITTTILMAQAPAYGMPPSGNLAGIGHVFELTAVYSDTGQPAHLAPGQTYTMTVQYADSELGPVVEDSLALYYWDEEQWVKETSSTTDTDLPIILKND
jgi:oligopeptide transport system substrate-binding protein